MIAARSPISIRRRHWLVTLAAALLVALAAAAAAAGGDVSAWEEDVFHLVNGLPDARQSAMWLTQLAGLLLVPAIVAVVAVGLERWRLAAALVLLIHLKLAVEHLMVKQLVERQRPATTICRYPEGDIDACVRVRDLPLDVIGGGALGASLVLAQSLLIDADRRRGEVATSAR